MVVVVVGADVSVAVTVAEVVALRQTSSIALAKVFASARCPIAPPRCPS